eukprot:CAMPEP_0197704298 /NCGR_PEP_ID=MMETSP1338-20131121/125866_1 /TAXON_ID=43686 ORGANISM="Pelagodinium beii, Strain RCC1491" /NCGR_SAMPLE_ID=MMETSP1338 /ASSEMBLY_ACC=CAM_ASM_000754 /LENGTH=607 /DNA_ID=CAMNT_0043288197 /DNA_START=186 /DNA_END=2010 /DNA_ORIENTATION=-
MTPGQAEEGQDSPKQEDQEGRPRLSNPKTVVEREDSCKALLSLLRDKEYSDSGSDSDNDSIPVRSIGNSKAFLIVSRITRYVSRFFLLETPQFLLLRRAASSLQSSCMVLQKTGGYSKEAEPRMTPGQAEEGQDSPKQEDQEGRPRLSNPKTVVEREDSCKALLSLLRDKEYSDSGSDSDNDSIPVRSIGNSKAFLISDDQRVDSEALFMRKLLSLRDKEYSDSGSDSDNDSIPVRSIGNSKAFLMRVDSEALFMRKLLLPSETPAVTPSSSEDDSNPEVARRFSSCPGNVINSFVEARKLRERQFRSRSELQRAPHWMELPVLEKMGTEDKTISTEDKKVGTDDKDALGESSTSGSRVGLVAQLQGVKQQAATQDLAERILEHVESILPNGDFESHGKDVLRAKVQKEIAAAIPEFMALQSLPGSAQDSMELKILKDTVWVLSEGNNQRIMAAMDESKSQAFGRERRRASLSVLEEQLKLAVDPNQRSAKVSPNHSSAGSSCEKAGYSDEHVMPTAHEKASSWHEQGISSDAHVMPKPRKILSPESQARLNLFMQQRQNPKYVVPVPPPPKTDTTSAVRPDACTSRFHKPVKLRDIHVTETRDRNP